MNNVVFDFSKELGKIKPMHSVNNGPVYKFAVDQRITNIEPYKAAGIPFARNHDASFCSTYGGEHIVDVNFIFTNPDADPYDPASYDFDLTDEYCRMIEAGGAKIFYRLGSKIEHWSKKYNTLAPKDFKKWAIVCEHIIKHYCYGWANGFNMDIQYWEIWNEPDLDPDDSTHKRCWGGTAKEFYELFNITLTHLKKCFPELKIGGPAIANTNQIEWINGLLDSLGEVKPDFFSWHVYADTVENIQEKIRRVRKMLDDHGLTECESILNEWNYVKGWIGDEWTYSLKQEKSLKGASFTMSTMLMSQNEQLDNLMYYDARPCGMNGLFSTDMICEVLKGYYPFYMFNQLYTLGTQVEGTSDDAVWCCGAKGKGMQNAIVSYYDDNDGAQNKDVKITFKNVENPNGVRLEYYLLDQDHDCTIVREEIFTANEFSVYLNMSNFSSYMFKIIQL